MTNKLEALRGELKRQNLTGFAVPLTDEHQSEYVGGYAQRLAWLTGFTGSAGNAVVLMDKAAVFVDGRYTLQVTQQVDPSRFEAHHIVDKTLLDWLGENTSEGDRIGYDPFLHTKGWVESAKNKLARNKAELMAVKTNPVDAVWTDQPQPSKAEALPHDLKYAGVSAEEKRDMIGGTLEERGADAAVLTALDSIAWAFNIRGRDVPRTPVALSFAVIEKGGAATLYMDPEKVNDDLRRHLGNQVALAPKSDFLTGLEKLGAAGKAVSVDPDSASAAVFESLEKAGAGIIAAQDPCALPKAKKNAVEADGTRNAHIRDGAAIVEFLKWVDEAGPSGTTDELSAVAKLADFRQQREIFQDNSFDTISGYGPNGAVIHYRVTPETNLAIKPGSLYLVDSGGQYFDGTTDITRTLAIGDVGAEEKDRFTRVLKGHIALATLRFPKGTTGTQIDVLARRPLWEAGLDYDHGTGHGVGSYLGVHEGPQRIAKLPNSIALEPGMILSNEPGYYKPGAYGIRIENLVMVREVAEKTERPMLEFETLTLAPIDRRLIDLSLLTPAELAWLNSYHARVRKTLTPLVPEDARPWLDQATAPLAA